MDRVVWTDRVALAITNSRNRMEGGRGIGLGGQPQPVGPEPLVAGEIHCPVVLSTGIFSLTYSMLKQLLVKLSQRSPQQTFLAHTEVFRASWL